MIYKRGRVWWYKFQWDGKTVRESTRQANKNTAKQMEAAHRTQLAKGEAGITDRKAPTLVTFLKQSFIPFVETTKAEKVSTVVFYKRTAKNLIGDSELSKTRLNEITAERVRVYAEKRRAANRAVATVNRELATLKRTLNLALEWGVLTAVPKIRLLQGERCRERVLSQFEEAAYLNAADPQLRTVATIILSCGLRPDEVYRLRWDENVKDGQLIVYKGKSKAARRAIPMSPPRMLDAWRNESGASNGWVFPAPTKTGHIDLSSLKKAHRKAVVKSGVETFVLYDLRHTCLTRWAKYLDPATLKKLAGHESLATTMRYIHLNETETAKRLTEARQRITQEQCEELEAALNSENEDAA